MVARIAACGETHADIEDFKAAMRQTVNGVCIVSTDGPRGRAGLTVSSMVSVSAEPPMLLVCINRSAAAHDVIRDNVRFAVNVLGTRQQAVADRFAGRGARPYDFGQDRWIGADAPVLEAAAAWFRCELDLLVPAGSHSIMVGRIVEAAAGSDTPLLYSDRTYGRPARLETTGTDSVLERPRRPGNLMSLRHSRGERREQHCS